MVCNSRGLSCTRWRMVFNVSVTSMFDLDNDGYGLAPVGCLWLNLKFWDE